MKYNYHWVWFLGEDKRICPRSSPWVAPWRIISRARSCLSLCSLLLLFFNLSSIFTFLWFDSCLDLFEFDLVHSPPHIHHLVSEPRLFSDPHRTQIHPTSQNINTKKTASSFEDQRSRTVPPCHTARPCRIHFPEILKSRRSTVPPCHQARPCHIEFPEISQVEAKYGHPVPHCTPVPPSPAAFSSP